MNGNEIHRKMTDNIILQFTSFKKGEINSKMMNENLILNLSSLFKFLKGKENTNSSYLDIFLPVSKLEYSVNKKIRGSLNDSKMILNDITFDNNMVNYQSEKAVFNDQDQYFYEPRDSLFNSKMDAMSMNFFNDAPSMKDSNLSKSTIKLNFKEEKDTASTFNNILNQSEISTIYLEGNKKVEFDIQSVSNMSVFRNDSFYIYKNQFDGREISSIPSNRSTIQFLDTNKSEKKRNSNQDNESLLEDSLSVVNATVTSKDNLEMTPLVKQISKEINNELSDKNIIELIKQINADYIRSLYSIYTNIRDACKLNPECENLIFINKFKSFVLEIGISDKKFYEQCIREIIYNKNNLKFFEFINCFHKLIYLKFEQNFWKYKYLFQITRRKNDEFMDTNDLEKFYELLKAKKIYDVELYNKITTKLVDKYKDIFPKDQKLYVRKLALVLEQFFDLK